MILPSLIIPEFLSNFDIPSLVKSQQSLARSRFSLSLYICCNTRSTTSVDDYGCILEFLTLASSLEVPATCPLTTQFLEPPTSLLSPSPKVLSSPITPPPLPQWFSSGTLPLSCWHFVQFAHLPLIQLWKKQARALYVLRRKYPLNLPCVIEAQSSISNTIAGRCQRTINRSSQPRCLCHSLFP